MVGCHLWKCCANYGPLVYHNCFAFASYYGYLVKLKNVNTSYSTKMLFTVGYYQVLQFITKEGGYSNESWQGYLMEKVGIPVKQVENK